MSDFIWKWIIIVIKNAVNCYMGRQDSLVSTVTRLLADDRGLISSRHLLSLFSPPPPDRLRVPPSPLYNGIKGNKVCHGSGHSSGLRILCYIPPFPTYVLMVWFLIQRRSIRIPLYLLCFVH
jgi:hypothetical protein